MTQKYGSLLWCDLGKALTPKDELPSHKKHEFRGLPLIKELCERLRVPKSYQALSLASSEYHQLMLSLIHT